MRTKEEILIAYDEILSELNKLSLEVLNNEKKKEYQDYLYRVERSRTMSALIAKLNFIEWLFNVE